MAATVSAWSKPGAWALDSEEHEAELLQNNNNNNNHNHNNNVVESKPLAEFPSLAVAAATKPKKKKAQTLSLAEFTAKPVSSFTHQDPVDLPTGPRQRTAEELERDRTRIGGGFGSYGGGRPNRNSESDESSVSRWGSSRVPRNDSFGSRDRDSNRDSQPSRADEIDNWAAAKKPSFGNGSDRRDRVERGGFFDSQSRADESDSWVTNKNFVPTEGRRFGGGGGGDRERRVGFGTSGGADSDNWNKKKVGEFSVASERTENVVVGGRPRLVLQPRTAPPSNENQDVPTAAAAVVAKPKGANPFGEARPREQVLAEKGQDWKKIDEQLESTKIKETAVVEGFGKRGFGSGNGRGEDRSERSWRKSTPSDDGRSESAEKVEDEHIEEN